MTVLPRPSRLRLVRGTGGTGTRDVGPPLGATFDPEADDWFVVLPPEAARLGTSAHDIAKVASWLPDPDALGPGALVVVGAAAPEGRSFGASLRAAFGRTPQVSRALRCSALVAKGFVEVAAGPDAATRADLAWARARRPAT